VYAFPKLELENEKKVTLPHKGYKTIEDLDYSDF